MLNLLLFFFSIVLLLRAILFLFYPNSIINALFVVLCFFIATILLIFLECDSLALMLLIIYVIAAAILFRFVLGMLNNLNKKIFIYYPFGVFVNVAYKIKGTHYILDIQIPIVLALIAKFFISCIFFKFLYFLIIFTMFEN